MTTVLIKLCPGCNTVKPHSGFYARRKRGPFAVQHTCIECVRERDRDLARRKRKRDLTRAPERVSRRVAYLRSPHGRRVKAEATLRERYGINFHDWALMFERQSGRCPGCLCPLRHDHSTHVDHDHITGRVRGLLCRGCNIKIGAIEFRTEVTSRLLAYLGASL